MTDIHGVTGTPYKHPEVRKKMPAPFNRPRVDLDGGRRVKRSWQDMSVLKVKQGDTVAGFGTVEAISEFIQIADHSNNASIWQVRLYNVLGDFKDYRGEHRVFAFAPESPHV
jgi:hypothetical protein